MIRDTSDCAIGYEAARSVLEGLDTFADEYASHLRDRSCQEGVGQTVPCETLCPAHVDVPAYIALTAAGDYAGASTWCARITRFPRLARSCASIRARSAAAARSSSSDQHSRHQEVRGGPARRRSGANSCPRRAYGQEGRHRGWRPLWPDLRILLRPDGT